MPIDRSEILAQQLAARRLATLWRKEQRFFTPPLPRWATTPAWVRDWVHIGDLPWQVRPESPTAIDRQPPDPYVWYEHVEPVVGDGAWHS